MAGMDDRESCGRREASGEIIDETDGYITGRRDGRHLSAER
jgi:hypothetical protein